MSSDIFAYVKLLSDSISFHRMIEGFMKNSGVSAYIASAIDAAMVVATGDPHRGTRRRAATTLLHAIQVMQT